MLSLPLRRFKKAFKKFDALAAPTMPIMPPRFSEIEKLSPIEQYQMDILTVPANLAGIPMISVPVKKGKTTGLHIIGNHLEEKKILDIANAYEVN